MTKISQLSPAAAQRIYTGPRYRRPMDQRRLRQCIERMKKNPCNLMRYMGHIAEAILKCQTTPTPSA